LKLARKRLKARRITNQQIAFWVWGETPDFHRDTPENDMKIVRTTAANYLSQYVNNGGATYDRFGERTIELFNQAAHAPQAGEVAEAPAPVQEAPAPPADQAAPEVAAAAVPEPEEPAALQDELVDDLADLAI